MNYIVFDLEWNQSPSGHFRENARIPFEILEIGAVKLNPRRKKVDEFHEYVKPLVYRTMNRQTHEVTHINMADLQKCRTFTPVCKSFLEWCGEEPVFVSWGPSDLYELQRNMEYYHIRYEFPRPLLYYDLQKLYSLSCLDGKKRPSLQDAVQELKLPEDMAYHSAFADACYTAKVMQSISFKSVQDYKSVDYYHLPATPQEELNLSFPTYSKYVSRVFESREEALKDKAVTHMYCNRCGLPVIPRISWFCGASGSMYYSLVLCPRHGAVKGKLRIRKAPGDRVYIVKTIKKATDADVEEIKNRKENAREKRHKRVERERENRRARKTRGRVSKTDD